MSAGTAEPQDRNRIGGFLSITLLSDAVYQAI
jgi:hypothetical protein